MGIWYYYYNKASAANWCVFPRLCPPVRPPARRQAAPASCFRSHCRVVERKDTEEPTMGVEIETITPGDGGNKLALFIFFTA